MKEYRGSNGERRLWYEPSEVDMIMTTELVHAKLIPHADDDDLTIDVEDFIQKYLKLRLDTLIFGHIRMSLSQFFRDRSGPFIYF